MYVGLCACVCVRACVFVCDPITHQNTLAELRLHLSQSPVETEHQNIESGSQTLNFISYCMVEPICIDGISKTLWEEDRRWVPQGTGLRNPDTVSYVMMYEASEDFNEIVIEAHSMSVRHAR